MTCFSNRLCFFVIFMFGCFLAAWTLAEDGGEIKSEGFEHVVASDVTTDRISVTAKKVLSISEAQSVKTPTPIIDVPQSLTIIMADEIMARGFNSVSQIIDYTPGVNTSQGEGHRDAVVFRGVRSTADFFLDGHRDDVQYYRALYNVEKVEILRGPNALLFGRGGTGGILNRVSKKATLGERYNDYVFKLNQFGQWGTSMDSNFDIDERTALRVNAMFEQLANDRDFYDGERIGLNPTLRYEINETTTLDLSYEYIDHERFIDRGVPTANGRPVEALKKVVFADPENNYHELKAHVFRANLVHRFAENIKGNLTLFYGDYDKVYANYYATAYDRATHIVELDGYIDDTVRDTLIVSGNLIGEFQAGGVEHTVMVGTELISTDSDQSRFNPVFSTNGRDRENFIVNRPVALNNGMGINANGQNLTVGFTDFNDDTRVDLDVFSFYVQDEIQLNDHFDLILGARFDRFDIEVFNADPSVLETRTRKDQEITPRAGFIYKLQENISVYLSYSESFLPRSGEQYADINGSNNALDPDTYTNRELGIKWDFAEAMSLTAAVFQNEQSSPQVSDDDPQTLDVIDSKTNGFELQLSGMLTDAWSITANYAYLDGEIIARTGPTGRTPAELPDHMFSIWTGYQLTDAFGLALGATHQGRSFVNSSNSAFLPSYTRFDAALYYDLSDSLRLQLNAENLTNKLYFPNAHSTHEATVGAPRHVSMMLLGSF